MLTVRAIVERSKRSRRNNVPAEFGYISAWERSISFSYYCC